MRGICRLQMLAAAIMILVVPQALRPSLSHAAPAEEQNKAPPEQSGSGTESVGCNTISKPPSAGGASVESAAGQGVQQKNWQAPGGEIEFSIRSFDPIPAGASVLVCFRWKTDDAGVKYREMRPKRIDLSSDRKNLKVTTAVPHSLPGKEQEFAIWLVPLADVRILAIGQSSADGKGPQQQVLDVSTTIGVTNRFWAVLLSLITILLAYMGLTIVCRRRLRLTSLSAYNPLLVIASPAGYASLSQLQIVVWTFVVAASAVYVMALSGELIEITTGTLVLLGISGATAVASKWHDETQRPSAPPAAPPAPPSVAPGPIPAPALPPVALPGSNPRTPLWSDLVFNEVSDPTAPGGVKREIDVARVQMLYFTAICASFVVLRVLTSYIIPEIPDGFQILMGISNAVYMGSKVAQK